MFQSSRRFINLLLLLAVLAPTALIVSAMTDAQDEPVSAVDFRNQMRELWEDHIVWTRMYIVSAVEDLPDQEFVAQRLLKNQDDIADAIEPFYGEEAADQLSVLLKDHILRAADLLVAAKGSDSAAFETANKAWYDNADDIAVFLNGANGDHWLLDELTHEMHMHLDLTLQEAVARLEGDYTADIAAYDEIHHHILRMADLLSQGIIDQFPDRFGA
jgi:hypothetical protein